MRKYFLLIILCLSFFSFREAGAIDRKSIIDSLTTIDPEIRKYFPRWKVCETDLLIQIYQGFRLVGFDEKILDKAKIEVLAAPHNDPTAPFEILLITCGSANLKSNEIDANFGTNLIGILAGEYPFNVYNPPSTMKRDYCYQDIPPEVPVSPTQAVAITSYLEPTNVNHGITISLFEQGLKIGTSGFWLKNILGYDEIGYPFWQAGESKVVLKRPLYVNKDSRTSDRIPYLINAYLGGAYRISAGITNENSIMSWIPERTLNNSPGGKMVAGLDFHMPFKPEAGVFINMELPLKKLQREFADIEDYGHTFKTYTDDEGTDRFDMVAPMLRASGQIALFYNWWLDNSNPENYIRADFGLNYCEVREVPREMYLWNEEYKQYDNSSYLDPSRKPYNESYHFNTYKPSELGDWIYAKLEFRNQATWPFGISVQYSNQIFLGRVYIPILGNWLYIEGKYATPLRPARPYEVKNFFMVSPVLRITI